MSLGDDFRQAINLSDRRPMYEWAADNVTLPPVLTKSGLFNVSGSRHFMGPMDALTSDVVREVNVMAPVRGGKTLIADIAAPWAIINEHASVLRAMQSDEVSASHSELRAMPMAVSVPGIRAILPDDRHKVREQEIIFSNGLPYIICGPSIGNLQSRGFKWVICDEPWLYKPGILNQAKARLGDFVRTASSKFLCISQGGTEGDDWDVQFQTGELNEWHVKCASCGHMMIPRWSGFRADGTRWGMMFDGEKNERGQYNIRKALDTLRFECEACGHAHSDTARTRGNWNLTGEYRIIGEPNTARKSFRWRAQIDYPWAELLEEWLNARRQSAFGNHEPTIQFVQKRQAEPKSEKTVHEGTLQFARAKVTDEKWEEEVFRCVTVDKQGEDTYWLTARQWAKGTGESRRLLFKKCYSQTEIEAAVAEVKPSLVEVMLGEIDRPTFVQVYAVFIDSGFKPKGDLGVYAMCATNHWVAVKGTAEPFFWHKTIERVQEGRKIFGKTQKLWAPGTWGDPGDGTRDQGLKQSPLFRIASDQYTTIMQEQIDRGLWVEPEGDSETEIGREYERQMSSEFKKKKTDKFTGKEELAWVCPSNNNHARDCGKIQVFAAMLFEIL